MIQNYPTDQPTASRPSCEVRDEADQTALLRVVHRNDWRSYGLGALTATCVLVGAWCALRIAGMI